MERDAFDPDQLTILVGDTVRWMINAGPHTIVSGSPGAPDGLWNSGRLTPGKTFTYTFAVPGTFDYFDSDGGPDFIGSITVLP